MINSFKKLWLGNNFKITHYKWIFSRGGGGGKSKGFFFCHARDFISIKEAQWPSGKDTGFVVW